MKLYLILISFFLILFSCKQDNVKPKIVVEDPEPTDSTQNDTTDVVKITCPIDKETYSFDTTGFEMLNSDYTYAEFKPSVNISGWSFEEHQGSEIEVLASGGECNGSCTTNVTVNLNDGFDKSCGLVGCWFTYITYKNESSISYVKDSTQLKAFFGNIDTRDEAIFWAYTNGYKMNYSGQNPKENGIKEVDTGYELRAYIWTGFGCGGYSTRTAYHLHICPVGEITILSEEVVYHEIDYMCE